MLNVAVDSEAGLVYGATFGGSSVLVLDADNGNRIGEVAVGNAPTALIEVVRLIEEEGVRPALVLGMPVGFVSAAESKERLMAQQEVPWIAIRGRKGGSTLAVAALHALLALAEEGKE